MLICLTVRMVELLLEIFSEEMPATAHSKAAQDLASLITIELKNEGVGDIILESFSTPRRLTVFGANLPETTIGEVKVRKGPRIDAPEIAIKGFLGAVSQISTDSEYIKIVASDKGDFFEFRAKEKPQQLEQVLPKILEMAFNKLSWPKSMRWNNYDCRWIRPIRNILAIFAVVFDRCIKSLTLKRNIVDLFEWGDKKSTFFFKKKFFF